MTKDSEQEELRQEVIDIFRALLESHGVDVWDEYWKSDYEEADDVVAVIKRYALSKQIEEFTRMFEGFKAGLVNADPYVVHGLQPILDVVERKRDEFKAQLSKLMEDKP